MATRATAPNEVVVQIIPAGNTPSQKPELLTEDLEEQLHVDQTRKQKIVLAALYTVVARQVRGGLVHPAVSRDPQADSSSLKTPLLLATRANS